MEIVVTGRNVEVPDHFRTHVEEKLTRVEKYDSKIIRVEVELSHETNRRQSKNCQRVQLTMVGRGPVMRAEASTESFQAAVDLAVDKLDAQLRRAHDRRRRSSDRTPLVAVAGPGGVGEVEALAAGGASGGVATLAPEIVDPDPAGETAEELSPEDELSHRYGADGDSGRIVRIKDHPGDPITVDQALFQMELVGHDFYLFKDVDTGMCSVVYRRKGFDYGLLRLNGSQSTDE
ncbi:ribosome hibernation-promoting factor, HPF/YfiA family [Nakamurella leprariae]|uniref:Ribosome hibernation promoting factor n=1 Tax=Nakamurella leprariae TaxID=2803911 RepID=A0A938YES2_9ACTN|nr:ribosome-associated translation inhibitor RaiA [Nakamurella leprariae]MBM9468216.1 ribosome-associated translation inhibitor RaiA [Nakamurella leprariae]